MTRKQIVKIQGGVEHKMSTLRIPLDEAALLRIACGQDVPAPLTVPSLAHPGPSSRDRFSSLRRSNACIDLQRASRGTHESKDLCGGPAKFRDRHAVAPAMCAAWHGQVGMPDQEQDHRSAIRLWVCRDGLGGGGWGSDYGSQRHPTGRAETRRVLCTAHTTMVSGSARLRKSAI